MMSVIGALIALRHWMRLSARGRLGAERRAKTARDLPHAASATAGGRRG
jgi:putative membrane protein